jgi:phenylalanyl-tRNA synthetase alpha chain
MKIEINYPKEKELIQALKQRTDFQARRLVRFLNLPDLSRSPESPIFELVQRILKIPRFADFDDIKVPEIVPADISFNLFNFPKDHPARSPSDTYYVDENHVLRTHTTVMWYYWLQQKMIREKIAKKESAGCLSYGKVYRKDEIDRNHMNVFHQLDGWYLTPKSKKIIGEEDLKEVLVEVARAVFGSNIQYRFNKDEFPYTEPSLEMEVEKGGRWIEILGSGLVHPQVLKNLGIDPEEYNGWAFGSGLERLAILSMELPDIRLLWSQDERVKRQLKLDHKFKEVSKYPPIIRDISFVVDKDFVPNNYFDLIRDLGGDLVEEVKLIDRYEAPEKFGKNKLSYTYRIVYRSTEKTLKKEEVDVIQDKIYQETEKQFQAQLR